ncbi:hypothetical protein [Ohtaekwangia sp.]|uniref:hypothetical protein n=1 Tax=Ohtaekwangia sp. TaxID=2066019 RepID=UPI002F91D9F0
MKSFLIHDGVSARQKAIHPVKQIVRISAWWISFFLVVLMLSSCHEKSNGQVSENHTTAKDSIKPKVNIQVNRHYDDKGNVIGFDSTYSSYYSNIPGDTARMDSLMHGFDRYFNQQHSSFFRNEFNPLFFNDSLRYPDFFHNDFFLKRYELNDAYMRNMMQRMDSIKNQFYREQSKSLKETQKEKKKSSSKKDT